MTINKLSSIRVNLSSNLWLAAYLHGVKTTYPNFLVAYQSSTWTNLLNLSIIIAELENKSRQIKISELTALPTKSSNNNKKETKPY